MAYTKLGLYNLALRNLGITTSLQSPEGNDAKVVALNTYYEPAKNQTLKDADWNFARAYRTLALTESAKSDNPKYSYEYERPEDCLYSREVYAGIPGEKLQHEPASSYLTGKEVINTNVYGASLKYTRRIDEEALFSVDFGFALGWHLSYLIADSVGMASKKDYATKMYSYEIGKAIIANSNEGLDDTEEKEPDWMRDRNG